jgi:hypothetical protein
MKEVLFITKTNVLPGHTGTLDCRQCARVHVTALKTHSVEGEAMAARAMWAMLG